MLEIQYGIARRGVPAESLLEAAARAALDGLRGRAEIALRVVGAREARALNRRFRGVDKPTNVLSFTAEGLEAAAPDFLGDLVLCAPLVAREAREQGKSRDAHWSHLVVHGVLHLLGFDHDCERNASEMENRERAALAALGYADPYAA